MIYKTFEDINRALFELAKLKSKVTEKEAKMNNKINAIKEKFDADTLEDREKIKAYEVGIQEFCKLNKNEFDKTRVKKLTFGSVGYRTGTPKVRLLNRKYNWKTVLELVSTVLKGKYIRTKKEVDKEKILSDYSQGILTDEKVAAAGMAVDQGEIIKIDIDWETFNEAV